MNKPQLIIQEYFNGSMSLYGIIKNRQGKIIRKLEGTMLGHWDKNGIGTIEETLLYNNGEKVNRIWEFIPINKNTFQANTSDIVGTCYAITNASDMKMDYTMKIPYKKRTISIKIQDRFYLQKDGVLINHSKMKKFGFTVGEFLITIIKNFPLK